MMASQVNGGNRPVRNHHEDDDTDDEVLASTLAEAMNNDEGDYDEGEGDAGFQVSGDDLQQRLTAAAMPLEYQAGLPARFISYDNYCSLFHFILNSDGPVDFEMPSYYWAWDVIDEFIYQFNSFCTHRHRVARASQPEEEIALLKESPQTWGCYSVLNVLYSLIQRSQMNEQLAAIKRGEDPDSVAGEYGSRPLYRMLGYFSIIGLLRVHCLLGDFTLALKTLDDIELDKKGLFAKVIPAHFTTYYYVGFSYMMMRRYADAIRNFSLILVYISRTKNFQKSNNQFDSISKMSDQMYALIAICVALCPVRLDDTIHTSLREKYGDQYTRMQRGGPEAIPIFEELFRSACPKFISPNPPDFDTPENNVEPVEHHLKVFMYDVKNTIFAPVLKSYLKLYTTMDLNKLASFVETDAETLRKQLVVYKQKNRQVRWVEGSLLEGELTHTSDLDFALQGDIVHVSEAKVGRKLVDWYLRNLQRTY